MEEKSNKGKAIRITLIVAAVVLFLLALPYIIIWLVFSFGGHDKYTVKTEYDDEFQIIYDGFSVKSSVIPITDPNPNLRFDMLFKFKVEENDFVGLVHNDDLTVYKLDSQVFYKDKTGWYHLDSDTKKNNPEAAKVIEEAIRSDTKLYNEYKQYL